ncbi:MAG: hypothetical protein WB586_16180 [Chthoniobacterales bacterium]
MNGLQSLNERVEKADKRFDACSSLFNLSFRSLLRTLHPRLGLKRSLSKHLSLWLSLAAMAGCMLSRISAERPKIYELPEMEDQARQYLPGVLK